MQFDPKIVPINRDGKLRLTDTIIQTMLAGGDIKLPAMPRAGHDFFG
jgi:hypothetical protein